MTARTGTCFHSPNIGSAEIMTKATDISVASKSENLNGVKTNIHLRFGSHVHVTNAKTFEIYRDHLLEYRTGGIAVVGTTPFVKTVFDQNVGNYKRCLRAWAKGRRLSTQKCPCVRRV